MKRIVLIIIKFILTGFFLYNIGLISFLINIKPEKQPPLKEGGWKEDQKYLEEKINRAQSLGTEYGPELYFSDLTDIELRRKKNDFDRSVIPSVQHSINQLLSFFSKNVQDHRKYDSDEDYKKFEQRLFAAQKKCKNITDPDLAKREAEFDAKLHRPDFWPNLFLSILVWLGNFYLKNFLLAFALLWVWWYQEKDKVRINNPLSFFVCLALYPITIVRAWIKIWHSQTKILAMKIEFRRRQVDLFSLISKDELADIKLFAQNNLKASDYRNYLNNRGFIRRQALVPVIALTLIFLVIPKASSSGANYSTADVFKYQLEVKAPPGINLESLNHNDHQDTTAILFIDQFIFQTFFIRRIIIPLVARQSLGFETNPDPVPLSY